MIGEFCLPTNNNGWHSVAAQAYPDWFRLFFGDTAAALGAIIQSAPVLGRAGCSEDVDGISWLSAGNVLGASIGKRSGSVQHQAGPVRIGKALHRCKLRHMPSRTGRSVFRLHLGNGWDG